MYFQKFTLLIVLLTFINCKSRLNEVNIKNEEGKTIEKYYIDKDSLRQGEHFSFFENGQLFEKSFFKNDVFEGERLIYHKNGEVEIQEQYNNGKLNGPYKTFYDNGQLNLLALYNNGVMEGIVKRYYESGELMEEVTFSNNMENGPFKEFYKNGQIKWEGNYKDGDNEYGIIKEFDEAGKLIKKMQCGKYKGEYICQTIWTLEEGDKAITLIYDEE